MVVIALTFSIIFAYLEIFIIALLITLNFFLCGKLGALFTFFLPTIIVTIVLSQLSKFLSDPYYGESIVSLVAALPILLSGTFIARKTVKGNLSFYWIRHRAIFLAAVGGTSFYKANLSNACFDTADLKHTDFREANLTRTSFYNAVGLDFARLQGTILENPHVRQLLITRNGYSNNLIGTNLCGANLRGADLREAILARADVTQADFNGAKLTGICIQDWNINSETIFTNIQCDYVYRKLDENGNPTDRFPSDRNFEPGEFESLYQEIGNVAELIFKEGFNWRAFAFSIEKLQVEDEGLDLQLKGIEKRGDLWVVKVTHNEDIPTAQVEQQLKANYENLQRQLANKEQQINYLLGIASNQAVSLKDQAESIKELSKKPFGNNFTITGSTITNLAGGQIEYAEAADQIRSLVAGGSNLQQMTSVAQTFLEQLQNQNIATSPDTQVELIQQIILSEAQKDKVFEQFLLQQDQQILDTMDDNAIASAIQAAIAQLKAGQK